MRIDDVEAHAVVEGQLLCHTPGVFNVVEVAPLPLSCIRLRAVVAPEIRRIAQQKSGQTEASAFRPARAVLAEGQLARAVRVARHPQVVGAPEIDAELHRMVSLDFRHVVYPLKLLLILIQRTVAAVHAESGAEIETERSGGGAPHKSGEQPGGEVVAQVETRDPGVLCGRRSDVEGEHGDLVAEEAEAEVRQERWRKGIVEPKGDAVVADLGGAAGQEDAVDAVLGARGLEEVERLLDLERDVLRYRLEDRGQALPGGALDLSALLQGLRLVEAVSPEEIEFVAEPPIAPNVKGIAVEPLNAGSHVVVARAVVAARGIG